MNQPCPVGIKSLLLSAIAGIAVALVGASSDPPFSLGDPVGDALS